MVEVPKTIDNPLTKKKKTFFDYLAIGVIVFILVLAVFLARQATPAQRNIAAVIAVALILIYIFFTQKERPPDLLKVADNIRSKSKHAQYEDFLNTNPSNLFGEIIGDYYFVEFRDSAKVVKYDWVNKRIIGIRRGRVEDMLKEINESEIIRGLLNEDLRKQKQREILEEHGFETPEE